MPRAQRITHSHETFASPSPPGAKPEVRPTQPEAKPSERSLEFQTTGAEIPLAVYKTVVWAYAWILAVAWFAFSKTVEAAWLATVSVIVGIVFFGIPVLLRRTNHAFARAKQCEFEEFLYSNVEIATGRLPGWEAYLQIIIIPVCLALAATALGSIWLWVS